MPSNNLNHNLMFLCNALITMVVLSLFLSSPGQAGEVLLRCRPGVSPSELVKGGHTGLRVARRFRHLFRKEDGELVLLESPSRDSLSLVEELKSDPRVASVSVNHRRRLLAMPNDPLYAQQWYMNTTRAQEAWNLTTGSRDVVVMVLDTGIEAAHQDLAGNLWVNPNDPLNGYDDDKNGYLDDVNGIDAIGKTGMVFDGEGHGSHVAGTIGAVGNNQKGITGVNWKVSMVSCRFADATGYGSDSNAITCIDYAVALKKKGVNIVAINASWGGYGDDPLLEKAIRQATAQGIAFVCAAGNEGNNNDAAPLYPASYAIPGVISVASVNTSGGLSYFSNTGPGSVDIAAPGEQMVSAYLGVNYQPAQGDIFYDPCDDTWTKWSRTGTWQVTAESSHDGGMAWSDSPNGEYRDNTDSSITSPPINLAMKPGNCAVGFWAKTSIENNYDYLMVQVSRDNFHWVTIGALTGTSLQWKRYAFYIPPQLKSSSLRLRFRMVSDEMIHYDGVYLDDIGVNCGDYQGENYAVMSGTSMAAPMVTGTLALLASLYPGDDMPHLLARLMGGIAKDGELYGSTASGGRLNIYKALTASPPPLITDASPQGATPGSIITVTGVNLGDEPGTLWFESSDGASRAKGEVTSWSTSAVVAKVPSNGGTYLRVERADGSTSPRFLAEIQGIPMTLPNAPRTYTFHPDAIPGLPKTGTDPATTLPFSLGEDSYSTMHLFVSIPKFQQPVDVYVAIQGVEWSTNDPLFLATFDSSGAMHIYNATSAVLYRYASGVTGPISNRDLLAPGFPVDEIPTDWGLNFMVAVVPKGSEDWSRYYLWWTSWY